MLRDHESNAQTFAELRIMKTLTEFEYESPQTIAEVGSLLKKYQEEAKCLAGGTDLLVFLKDRVLRPKYVVDLRSLPGLDIVKWDTKEGLTIGALTTISTILDTEIVRERYICLHEAAASFGTSQIRNMATLGGNICRSSPAADMVPPLLVFDSEVRLVSQESQRTVPLNGFFIGPGKNVLKDEILTEIRVPPQNEPYGTAFGKLVRTSEDLAKVNCAVKIVVTDGKFADVKIALGSVAPTPVRAKTVERALVGKEPSTEAIADAAMKVTKDISPITDNRSTAEYRNYVSPILVRRLIAKALTRLGI